MSDASSFSPPSQADLASGWVIVPAYREETMIASVVEELQEAGYQVLVVDDGSPDQTALVAQSSGARVLRHAVNLGQGAALETGMTWARTQDATWVAHFDADGQHAVEDIARLLAWLPQCDVVLGSRFLPDAQTPGMPNGRRRLLRLARKVQNVMTGVKLTDAHCGLRVLGKEALHAIRLEETGMAHATEIISQIRKKQLRLKEVPVTIRYSEYSLQKGQSWIQGLQILGSLLFRRLF